MSKKPPKKQQGIKHEPTPETRATVESLISFGITQAQICEYIGVTDKTLQKNYAEELKNANTKATAAVAGRLFKKAVEDGDTTCIIFWLKTRARWRESDIKEIDKVKEDNQKIQEEFDQIKRELLEKHKKDY